MKLNLFKCRKNQKYSINQLEIVEGRAKQLPKLLWFYVQSNNNPKDFTIELAKEDALFKRIKSYSGLIFNQGYALDPFSLFDNRKDLKHYSMYHFDFLENCNFDDVYEYNDFVGLSKAVMRAAYKLFGIENADENINYYIKENITKEEVQELIKKIHREYMDNKKNTENDNDKGSTKRKRKIKFYRGDKHE